MVAVAVAEAALFLGVAALFLCVVVALLLRAADVLLGAALLLGAAALILGQRPRAPRGSATRGVAPSYPGQGGGDGGGIALPHEVTPCAGAPVHLLDAGA